EAAAIKAAVNPEQIFMVVDAMTGQDAVNVAAAFAERVDFDGVIMSKMDGDARGGAALSIKSVTGASVKFVGMGEKLSELEVFHPDRIAGRILGMGDILTLVEKAQESIKQEEAEEMARKMKQATFDLEDFLKQLRRVKKLGSLDGILKMIPGMGGMREKLAQASGAVPEKELAKFEAIISSMTPAERHDPDILNGSRRARIAKGAGVPVQQVNVLIRQFEQMRQMMKGLLGGGKVKAPSLPNMPRGYTPPGTRPGLGMPGMGMPGMGMPGMPGMPGMEGMPPMPMPKGGSAAKSKEAQKAKKKKRKEAKKNRHR
ncbi:MAG: signal recognition particle protein, partial [Desulfovibrio sp.]|nr:signal recognition particle protein [Desulfovibrio sp.]